MKSYELARQLLSLLETFENENERGATLSEFVGFLNNRVGRETAGSPKTEPRFGQHEQAAVELAYKTDNNISRLLIFMHRYAKSYLKVALKDSPLQTPEDFTCLAILLTHDHLSKTELITYNIQEKTSGSVVISRLIKAGLIREWKNTTDKRGKYISITDAGKALLYRVFEYTSQVGKIVTGTLNLEEKLTLQHLLQKLEDFHHPIQEKKQVRCKADLAALAQGLED